jgi:ADP-ribose pyrophosphatase YjhB (NUDIX family)
MIPQWLEWAREIQALAQTSNAFAENEYQRERFARLNEIAAEIISAHTGMNGPIVVQDFQDQRGYATPKIDVRGAAFRAGKLLMVREVMDGGWCMPGGWADVGDVPSEAAEREVLEEAGFIVKANKVIGVYDANRVGDLGLFHAFKIVFLCEILGGEARPSAETSEVRFFGRDEIPQNFAGERTKSRHIADAFAVLEDPARPTVFD